MAKAHAALEQAAAQAGIPILKPKVRDLDEMFAELYAHHPREYASKQPTGRAGGVIRCSLCGAPAGQATLVRVDPKPGVHEGGYVCMRGDCAGENKRYLLNEWRRILRAQQQAKRKPGRGAGRGR